MSESRVSIFFDKIGQSNYVLVLDHVSKRFMNVKISSPEEIYARSIERDYTDILNSFMVFHIDFCEEFNKAKSDKNFKKFSYSPKDISYLWERAPIEIKNEYERVFTRFKGLKPKAIKFVPYNPQGADTGKSSNKSSSKAENLEPQSTNFEARTEDFVSDPSGVNFFSDSLIEDNVIISNLDLYNLNDDIYYLQYANSEMLLNQYDSAIDATIAPIAPFSNPQHDDDTSYIALLQNNTKI